MSTSSSSDSSNSKKKKEKKVAKQKEAQEKSTKPESPKTPIMDKNTFSLPPKYEDTSFGTFDNTDYDDSDFGTNKESALSELSNFYWQGLVSDTERDRIINVLSTNNYSEIANSVTINESHYAIMVYSDKNAKISVAWSIGGPDSFHKPALNDLGITTTLIFLQYPDIVESIDTQIPTINDESKWLGWFSSLASTSSTMNDVSFMGLADVEDSAMTMTLMMHPKRIEERPIFRQAVKPRRTLVKIDTTAKKQAKNAKLQNMAKNSQSMLRSIKAVKAQSNLTRISQLETIMGMLEIAMESSDAAQDLEFEDNEITDYY